MSAETPEQANADAAAAYHANLPALLRPAHIMTETGLSKATVLRLINSGEIKSVRPTPGTYAVPREWFVEWIERLKAASLATQGEATTAGGAE
jgi:excisionase family DNA binding protein